MSGYTVDVYRHINPTIGKQHVVPELVEEANRRMGELLGGRREPGGAWPTLVRLLEDGVIPHEMRGRHRRVMLAHLLDYLERSKVSRRQSLEEMAREGEGAGLDDLDPTPPTRTA